MTDCAMCGEDLFGASYTDLVNIGKKEAVYLCTDCRRKVERNLEDGKGRYIVNKCKACGHIRGVVFHKYKPRGRPKGSRTDPLKRATRLKMKPLTAFGGT